MIEAAAIAGALLAGLVIGAVVTWRAFHVGTLLRVAEAELDRRDQLREFARLPRARRRRALHAARRARGRRRA